MNKSAREFSHGLDLLKLGYDMYVQYSVNMYDYDKRSVNKWWRFM